MPRAFAYAAKPDAREFATNQLKSLSSSLFSAGTSTLKSASSRAQQAGQGLFHAVAAGYEQLTAESADRERITFVKFVNLEVPHSAGLLLKAVLLLGYENGFQVWDVQDSNDVQELLSRRDGAVRFVVMVVISCLSSDHPAGLTPSDTRVHMPCCSFMEPVPIPCVPSGVTTAVLASWPILAAALASPDTHQTADIDSAQNPQHSVQLYSLSSHSYLQPLTFKSAILGLKCSSRLIVVALDAQIHAYDSLTLQHTFSAVTYAVSAVLSSLSSETAKGTLSTPLALGSAWLAYASNQASPCG